MGSVLAEVSSTGYITGARQMDVYGAPRATQGSPTSKHAYVGGLGHPTEDDTGLIYMRARWMDPVTGTFVSRDAIAEGNRHSYCRSDPVNGLDPSGHLTLPEESGACAESVGLDCEGAGVFGRFMGFVTRSLSESLNRSNIKILVEFVEDDAFSFGGNGRVMSIGKDFLIQLKPGGQNFGTLMHEIGELFFRLTETKMLHSQYTAAFIAFMEQFR